MSRLSVDSNHDVNEDTATPSWAEGAPQVEIQENEDDEETGRTYSRRRSLECSSVDVSIIGTDSAQGHTLYIIQVCSGVKQWEVARRYRDFCYLDKQLRKNCPKLKIPPIPPKQYIFSSTSAAVVDERRNQLESYLKSLMFMRAVWTRNDLALFLNDAANSMMFIWNFERMRKMQDMLSSLTVENESEKGKLTTDLTLAKTQVSALQERLSRMEMLLLQQATGMASEELSPSAIRSLSGMGADGDLAKRLAKEIDEESSQLYSELTSGATAASAKKEQNYAAGASNDEDELNPQDQAMIDEAMQAHEAAGGILPASDVVKVLQLATQESTPSQNKKLLKNLKGKTPEEVRALAVSLQLQEAVRISNEVLNEKFDVTSPDSSRLSESRASIGQLGIKAPPTFPLSTAEGSLFAHTPDASSSGWTNALCSEIDEIMQVLTPTEESLQARYKVFRYVRDLVSNTLGVQLFPVGSFVSHTYLPDGDVDASAFICKNENDSWYVKVNEALCMYSFSHGGSSYPGSKHSSFDTLPDPPELIEAMSDEMSISNVGFVNGDVKKIKIMINNIAVDISMNQIGSLYSQYLIETIDKFVGKDHLFKKSMLLVEAWSRYESPRHSQGGGSMITGPTSGARFSTWAITVMLIWVFNSEGSRIHSPIQALGHFLRIFSCFDWSKYALTVGGPVDAEDLSAVDVPQTGTFFPTEMLTKFSQVEEEVKKATTSSSTAVEEPEEESIMVGEVVVKIDKVNINAEPASNPVVCDAPPAPMTKTNSSAFNGMVTERDAEYVQGLINIIDPAGPNRNLVVGLDVEGYQVITSALYDGYKHFQSMCDSFAKLQTAHGASRLPEQDVTKVMKHFLINTQLKVVGWNPNFKKKPGNLSLAFGTTAEVSPSPVQSSDVDLLMGQFKELDFSLRFAEVVLGGRINHSALILMIIRILMHKGPMPVGEVGKNLQTMTGSDSISRRLKDQFGGLKKCIELAESPRLRIGSEHPFNPVVHLVPESEIPGWTGDEDQGEKLTLSGTPSLCHHAFVFIPVLAAAAIAAREKEAVTAANNVSSNGSVASAKSKNSFRRQPPFYVDSRGGNMARKGSGRGKIPASPRHGGMYGGYVGGASPMNNYRPMMMPQQQQGGMPGQFPPAGMVAIPVAQMSPMGSPMQPMYLQQMQLHYMQQQQQMYQNYQSQMHPSMASSLSSSYGAQSPMSHSPMAGYQSRMVAMSANHAHQGHPQTQSGGPMPVPMPMQADGSSAGSSPKNAGVAQQQYWG